MKWSDWKLITIPIFIVSFSCNSLRSRFRSRYWSYWNSWCHYSHQAYLLSKHRKKKLKFSKTTTQRGPTKFVSLAGEVLGGTSKNLRGLLLHFAAQWCILVLRVRLPCPLSYVCLSMLSSDNFWNRTWRIQIWIWLVTEMLLWVLISKWLRWNWRITRISGSSLWFSGTWSLSFQTLWVWLLV